MTRNTSSPSVRSLPLTYNLAHLYSLSAAIAVLMAIASTAGILFPSVLYPSEKLRIGFVATDALNLIAGLPILLTSMWLTRRGLLAGLLCWPGALLYTLYVYISYMALPMSAFLVPHMVLVALSAYSTIAIIARIDCHSVRDQLDDAVPARTTGWILTVVAIAVMTYQIVNMVSTLSGQVPPSSMDLVQWIDDLLIGSPAVLAGGYLLLRRKPLGYATGAALLLMCSLLFVGVIPAMVLQALSVNTPIDLIGILVVLVTGMVCFMPFGLYVRGVAQSDRV